MNNTEYKQTEVGLIPSDWDVKTLGEVGEVKMCRRIFNNETSSNGSIPFFKIGTFGREPDAYISKEQYDDYRKRFSFPRKGDILISAAGTIGRTIIYNGEDAYFQDSNIVWIENDFKTLSNEFLYHIYQVANYNTEGGTIQRLYNSILKATKFKCPTKAEQTAIATALSDADALISGLEKLIAKKRNIKQGAMQKLLQPKEGWEVKTLGEIAEMYSGGTPLTSIPSYYNGNIPWVVIADITKAGKYISETEKTISQEGVSNSSAKLFKKGVLLFAMYASIGKTTIALMDTTCNQAILGIEPKLIDKEYLYYYLSFKERHFITMGQTGTQSNLSKDMVQKLEIPIPKSKEEQIQIATILSDMDAEITALETKLEKYKRVKLGMMQNLLIGKIRLV